MYAGDELHKCHQARALLKLKKKKRPAGEALLKLNLPPAANESYLIIHHTTMQFKEY
jgi:hypothetical protein